MKIDFKSKKVKILIMAIVSAVILALIVTFVLIDYLQSNQSRSKDNEVKTPIEKVDPTISDYEKRIEDIDEKLDRVNEELGRVKVKTIKDNLTKYNMFNLDDYFEIMEVDKLEANIFNFVNEDIYLVKILPTTDLATVQTYYYKDNEFTALDIESQGAEVVTRYYIYKQKVIAEKSLMHIEKEKNGIVKMYIDPLKFDMEEKMLAVALDNYNYSKDESIKTQGEALELATKAMVGKETTIRFDNMEMIANKEYYVFQELSSQPGTSTEASNKIIAWVCIEKETGKAMYKDTLVAGNILITKEAWLEKNETIQLKIYHPNIDATATESKEYEINKAKYNKDMAGELVKIMNEQLGLGINTIKIEGGKATVDITTKSSETKFDNGSAGGLMAVESLTKTIFANTTATTIKVTVAGKENVEGNHFSFAEEFKKQ